MKSKLTQFLFHVSDGVNYICIGLSLVFAIVSIFGLDILNGFEGVYYSNTSKFLFCIGSLMFSVIFTLVTKHNVYAVMFLALLYLVMAIIAQSLLWVALTYILVTSLPYLLTAKEIYITKKT